VIKVEVQQYVWAALGDSAAGLRYFIMPNPRLLAVSANVPTTSIRY